MIKVKIRPKKRDIFFQVTIIGLTLAAIIYISIVAHSIVIWIISPLIMGAIIIFSTRNIIKRYKPHYVAVPIREDMIEKLDQIEKKEVKSFQEKGKKEY